MPVYQIERPKAFGGYPTPNLQTLNGDTVNKLFFLTENEWERARNEKQYDIIIVGSGFCALALAEQALRNYPSCQILILERGPYFLSTHFQNLGKPFDGMLAGSLETFPWTVSAKTANGYGGRVRIQHGMVPFFGGRSTLWSAWCPVPTHEEMHEWPDETIEATHRYIPSAEELLHVEKADKIDHSCAGVYGPLQNTIQELLQEKRTQVSGIYRTEAAPMAVDGRFSGQDFSKYSVPAELLSLAHRSGGHLDIVTNCIVEKIYQQSDDYQDNSRIATTLQTSRGVISLGDANLVLAMGTLPSTTLVRNSFPHVNAAGRRFGAHFISAIVARVPRREFTNADSFGELEIGAFYVAGTNGDNYRQQFHIQLTAISDKNPEKNAEKAFHYMPDVVATASKEQLLTSKDHVVFVCAVLGELDVTNPDSWFLGNKDDTDPTTNSKLQVVIQETDKETWTAMDNATFGILEQVLSCQSGECKVVEYWHGEPEKGSWTTVRPSEKERRVDMLVHESSTLHIGEEETAPVDTKYRLRGTSNVFVTGGALWPRSGSWNPTLTMVALAKDLADQLINKTKEARE